MLFVKDSYIFVTVGTDNLYNTILRVTGSHILKIPPSETSPLAG